VLTARRRGTPALTVGVHGGALFRKMLNGMNVGEASRAIVSAVFRRPQNKVPAARYSDHIPPILFRLHRARSRKTWSP